MFLYDSFTRKMARGGGRGRGKTRSLHYPDLIRILLLCLLASCVLLTDERTQRAAATRCNNVAPKLIRFVQRFVVDAFYRYLSIGERTFSGCASLEAEREGKRSLLH